MGTPPNRLLVTGSPGVGKTTLIMRVLEKLKLSHPQLKVRGFFTREIRESGERIGFEVVTVDGRSGGLATTKSVAGSNMWPKVGKYKVNIHDFEALALPELDVNGSDTELFVIDEVGKMELFSSAFFPAIWAIFNSKVPVVASIPILKYKRDIPEVSRLRTQENTKLYMLTKSSRDDACLEVYDHIKSILN